MTNVKPLSYAARKLRTWRKEHGKTQKDVGDALGVYSVTVGGWERGDQRPSLDSIVALEQMTEGYITAADWTETQAA